MGMLRYAPAITVYGDLPMIMIGNLRYLQIINVIPHSQYDLIRH